MTAMSLLQSNLELTATWSSPLVTIMGAMQLRLRVMGKLWMVTGLNCSTLGYMSSGDSVPDVITTVWKRSNTGLMAMDASMQLKCRISFLMAGALSSQGSMMRLNPCVYVPTRVANMQMWVMAEKSSRLVSSSVRSSDPSRSAQNLRGFLSMWTSLLSCCRNDRGLSCSTRLTRMRFLRCSTNLLRKDMKCSALRMLPGTASCSTASGSTGFASTTSCMRSSFASLSPCTRRLYSSLSRSASLSLISATWRDRVARLRVPCSRVFLLMSTLMLSMHTLSMLWASSKTTMLSLARSFETISAILGSSR
eukprot:comp15076_c1_seq1/m.11724 comp15076_c1_seq1/g.11724  ORF comp15076_c1_seq1/g.11724 comp15076_c1_seq1/m.11724 type:complete len:307 (+) comp15076_c1_seq1:1366-2286(+)